ncbi:hypothetical protein L218DRAFT_960407 [Marasmius fiardii PR-910]|nr:hypothetical protein L218DRAFT_960407 [Marasmius fiardii PR-910]
MIDVIGPTIQPTNPDETISVYPKFNSMEILIATWFNLLVYTFEFVLGVYYLNHTSRKVNRRIVGVILLLETTSTVIVCVHGYNHFFVYDDPVQAAQTWNIPVLMILTTLSTMMEQLYFTHRFWRISYNRLVAGAIAVTIIARGVFSACFILHSRITLYRHSEFITKSVIVAASFSVGTDLVIAGLSAWKVKRIKTVYDTTRNFLKKMSVYAITCGIVSSLATIVSVIIAWVSLNLFNVVFYALGRIYTLTVLLNLIIHRGLVTPVDHDLPEPTPGAFPLVVGDHINLSNLSPLSRRSLIMAAGQVVTTCDEYIDENGHYRRPPPAPSFSMDAI